MELGMGSEKYDESLGWRSQSDEDDDAIQDRLDAAALAAMGKRQVLKRKFGALSILGFSCTILTTWEGMLVTLGQGLLNGGALGLIGQFVLCWGGTLSTFLAIGELASMAPTAGGQYHWVAMLAPRSMRNFLSYLTGWINVLAWVCTMTTGSYWAASMIQTICTVDYPEYQSHAANWQITLMMIAVILVVVTLNTVIGNWLPHLEGWFLILHVMGFFGILIPLVYYAPKGTANEIFTGEYAHYNGGNWPTYGVSFMVGSLGSAVSFVGADAAVHLSEEIHNASVNVPRSIFLSIMMNGVLGFAMLIAVLFCMGPPAQAVEAELATNYPIIEIFVQATHSVAGSTVMTAVLLTMAFAATTGAAATASRMIWAFARDRGLPFSSFFSRVSTQHQLPIAAVLSSAIIPCLLGMINVGSTAVFQAVTSLTMVGFYSTYLICCVLLLIRRLQPDKIDTCPSNATSSPSPAWKNEKTDEYILTWGRWHFSGWFGVVNNVVAVCYLVVVGFFGFWPQQTPVDARDMSYSCVVFGGTVLVAVAYWAVWGRRLYQGPVVEIVM